MRLTTPPVIMTDSDAALLASEPTITSVLAAKLNAAMDRDASAREAYARIYGCEWAPLGNGARINDGASAIASTVR
jgi:hypothetical protein